MNFSTEKTLSDIQQQQIYRKLIPKKKNKKKSRDIVSLTGVLTQESGHPQLERLYSDMNGELRALIGVRLGWPRLSYPEYQSKKYLRKM